MGPHGRVKVQVSCSGSGVRVRGQGPEALGASCVSRFGARSQRVEGSEAGVRGVRDGRCGGQAEACWRRRWSLRASLKGLRSWSWRMLSGMLFQIAEYCSVSLLSVCAGVLVFEYR